MESLDHDQYHIKVDGSGRLTLCNYHFLRMYTSATPSIRTQPVRPLSVPEGADQSPREIVAPEEKPNSYVTQGQAPDIPADPIDPQSAPAAADHP